MHGLIYIITQFSSHMCPVGKVSSLLLTDEEIEIKLRHGELGWEYRLASFFLF